MELIGAGRIGRLGYTGRFGPTVLPVRYKLHKGSIVFHALEDTFSEEDLRTGIAHAEYRVAFEVDQYFLGGRAGWFVEVVGSAHHVNTEAERAAIIHAAADPWPEAEWEHLILIRIQPVRIGASASTAHGASGDNDRSLPSLPVPSPACASFRAR